MKRRNKTIHITSLLLILTMIGLILPGGATAVTKIPKTLNFLSISGGINSPVGTVEGIPGNKFLGGGTLFVFDATDAYENANFLSFDYGQVYFRHLSLSVGFYYIGHSFRDSIFDGVTPKLKQYDLAVKSHYLLNDLRSSFWTPYAGLSLLSGFTTVDWGGAENENRLTLALGIDFGAEVKLHKFSYSKGFLTLASVNSYNFLTTGDRPQYLQIGGALKYYYMD